MAERTYKEIARAQVNKSSCLVISEVSDGSYMLSKILKRSDITTGEAYETFCKGATVIKDPEVFKGLIKMFETAVKYAKK